MTVGGHRILKLLQVGVFKCVYTRQINTQTLVT